MNWTEVLAIIGGLAAIFIGVMFLFKWAIDAKFKAMLAEFKAIRAEFKGGYDLIKQGQENQEKLLIAKVEPIDKNLNNHVTDTNKKIDKIDNKLEKLDSKVDQLLKKQAL